MAKATSKVFSFNKDQKDLFSFNLTNITNSGKETDYTTSWSNSVSTGMNEYLLRIACVEGYGFKEAPIITKFEDGSKEEIPIEVNKDRTEATYQFTNTTITYGMSDEWKVYPYSEVLEWLNPSPDPSPDPSPEPNEPEPEPEPIGNYVSYSNEHVSVNLSTEYSPEPDYFPTTYDLIPNIKKLVEFGDYIVTVKVIDDSVLNYVTIDRSPEPDLNFTLSGDKKTATMKIEIQDNVKEYFIDVMTYSNDDEEEPIKVNTFNNLYLVDINKMKEISDTIRSKVNDINLSGNFINLIRFPFEIENKTEQYFNILIGGFRFSTTAQQLIDDELIINFGEIDVPQTFNNSFDFVNTTCLLHLPFNKTITLDTEYVIGQKVKVVYIIDLLSGDTTINILSSKTDNIFETVTTQIGTTIPFLENNESSMSNNKKHDRVRNDLDHVFIEVVRNLPVNVNSMFNNTVEKTGKLADEKGFITVDEIVISGTIGVSEKETIERLLSQGVYIK